MWCDTRKLASIQIYKSEKEFRNYILLRLTLILTKTLDQTIKQVFVRTSKERRVFSTKSESRQTVLTSFCVKFWGLKRRGIFIQKLFGKIS